MPVLGRFKKETESLSELINLMNEIGYNEIEVRFKEVEKLLLTNDEEPRQLFYNCKLIISAGTFWNRLVYQESIHKHIGAQVKLNIDSVRKEAARKAQFIEEPIKKEITEKLQSNNPQIITVYEQGLNQFFN